MQTFSNSSPPQSHPLRPWTGCLGRTWIWTATWSERIVCNVGCAAWSPPKADLARLAELSLANPEELSVVPNHATWIQFVAGVRSNRSRHRRDSNLLGRGSGHPARRRRTGILPHFRSGWHESVRTLATHASSAGDVRDVGVAGRSAGTAGLDRVRGVITRGGGGGRRPVGAGTPPRRTPRSLRIDDSETAQPEELLVGHLLPTPIPLSATVRWRPMTA